MHDESQFLPGRFNHFHIVKPTLKIKNQPAVAPPLLVKYTLHILHWVQHWLGMGIWWYGIQCYPVRLSGLHVLKQNNVNCDINTRNMFDDSSLLYLLRHSQMLLHIYRSYCHMVIVTRVNHGIKWPLSYQSNIQLVCHQMRLNTQ